MSIAPELVHGHYEGICTVPDVGEVGSDILSRRTVDHGGEVALQEEPGLLAVEVVPLGQLEHSDSF